MATVSLLGSRPALGSTLIVGRDGNHNRTVEPGVGSARVSRRAARVLLAALDRHERVGFDWHYETWRFLGERSARAAALFDWTCCEFGFPCAILATNIAERLRIAASLALSDAAVGL